MRYFRHTALASTIFTSSLFSLSAQQPSNSEANTETLPNFIIIFVDDMGYGDLGCYGNEAHKTPNIDKMAENGMQFTDFYVTSGVCSPSRSSLMTGCYPKRVDMHFDSQMRPVLFPISDKGLNPDEQTIAEILKQKGYATACIGKWHLGDQVEYLPTKQGFDYYYGIPYSNDMGPKEWAPDRPVLPLLKGTEVIEAPVDQNTLTQRYTQEALSFINKNQDNPFFLYLPHSMVHAPLHASEKFKGKSMNGIYGDAVQEIDWSTGEILALLKKLKIDKNTLVIFTSDNGADPKHGGSNKPLKGFKGSTWEGGMRVPCIMRWPEIITAGTKCSRVVTTMDFFPTFAQITDADLPDLPLDGHNIISLLKGEDKQVNQVFAYYMKDQLHAIRSGKWKLHLPLNEKYAVSWKEDSLISVSGALYNLEVDISESNDVSADSLDIVKELLDHAEAIRLELGDMGQCSPYIRMAGYTDEPKALVKED